MSNATEITIVLNDVCLISFFIIFALYNFILIQLAPFIKKFFGKIYDKMKEKRPVGFPMKYEK